MVGNSAPEMRAESFESMNSGIAWERNAFYSEATITKNGTDEP
jgi:hypothetical protein